jgi:hypothetical protein
VSGDAVRLAGTDSTLALLTASARTDSGPDRRLLGTVEAGVTSLAKEWDAQIALLQATLTRNINVVEYVLAQHGHPVLGAPVTWKAINQVTKEAVAVTLPRQARSS